ncbi:MAG: hypothetical protein CR981_01740 [Proteobacteria bacterium]|nr:MAG: hypothetical protein CR981_01740 [Pseudomonadota bacterium]
MAVFGYIFLSDKKEHQVVLGVQQQRIMAAAADMGLVVDELIIEKDVPLKMAFRNRPEGRKMTDGLRPGDIVLVMRTEWLLGSAVEGAALVDDFRKKGISVYCLDLGENISLPGERKLVVSEGNAALVKKVLVALALLERENHGEAIKAVKRVRKKAGKYLGGPVPFGWRISEDGDFEENEEQQKIIEWIKEMRAARRSYRDIAVKLKENTTIGLSHEGIRRILVNDRRRKQQKGR